MNEDIIVFNTPAGRQDYLYFGTGADRVYSLPSGSTVVWNSISMGEPRFTDDAMFDDYGIYEYIFYGEDMFTVVAGQIGMWVREYGPNAAGQPGTIPFINGYVRSSFDYVPAHQQWLLDNHRKLVEVYAFKMWLYQTSTTLYDDVDTAVKATYVTEPLNKIRWEHKEFMPYGGVIFNIALPFLTDTDFELFQQFDFLMQLNYNDENEDNLI